MDSITQAALGAAIGSTFRPKLGRRAVVAAAVLGASPDLDVVVRFTNEWGMLTHHRGPTHSLIVLSLAAPIVGWAASRWSGRHHFRAWTCLAFLSLTTHALLDWCTPYGTQLLWPLTHRRFSIDAVPVLDPIYSAPLLIAALINIAPRLTARFARRSAIVALTLTTGYLGLGFLQARRGLARAAPTLASAGFQAVDVRATPTMFNIWLRRIVARDATDNLRVGLVSTWSPRPIAFERLDRDDDPHVRRALESPQGRLFRWFAMDMVSAHVEDHSDGAIVTLSDRRYGLISNPLASPFRVQAEFAPDGTLRAVRRLRRFSGGGVDIRHELSLLWRRIVGSSAGTR